MAPNRPWTLPNANDPSHPLLSVIGQYPVLEQLTAHLRYSDLFSLAQTCQTAQANLKTEDPNSRANLRSKTLCPGHGVEIRKFLHSDPQEGSFVVYKKCGGEDDDSGIETRPCVKCGIITHAMSAASMLHPSPW
ncbi:Nn.00g117830.m01.CDS01 [Neocucurbitaria sp. VM-36]